MKTENMVLAIMACFLIFISMSCICACDDADITNTRDANDLIVDDAIDDGGSSADGSIDVIDDGGSSADDSMDVIDDDDGSAADVIDDGGSSADGSIDVIDDGDSIIRNMTDDVPKYNNEPISNVKKGGNSFKDVQKLIDDLPAGSVLYLYKDYAMQNGDIPISISKDITIDGKGCNLINGLGSRIMIIEGGNVILKNIGFFNATGYNGGAIIVKSAKSFECYDSVFKYNSAEYGGAVSIESKIYSIFNRCTFTDNRVNNHEGGAIFTKSDLTCYGCYFYYNKAEKKGGAIRAESSVNCISCIFQGNKCKYNELLSTYGGAISSESSVNCTKCQFDGNTGSYGSATNSKVQAKIIATNAVGEFGTITRYSFQVVNSKTNEPIKNVDVIFRIYGPDLDATRTGATNETGYYTSPNLNLTANKYNLQLKVNSTNVICSAVTKTLTINKRDAVIDVKSRTVYYGVLDDIVATVKDKKTGKVLANTYVLVKLYTTAKKYINYAVATNKKGVLTFSPPSNLKVGKHKFTIRVLDKNYQSTTYTRYVTIKKAYGYFKVSNVKTYYRSGKLFKIKLINKKTKKGIYGAKTLVKVYYTKKKYYKIASNTTKNGILQFKIKYKPGTYKVVVSNNGDTGYSAKKVTKKIRVTKHPLKLKAVKLKVERLTNFKVKVISKKTKKGLSAVKVKIKVYTGKKFKTYTRKSNKKGIAYLKIKEKKGKHKVIVNVKSPKYYTANKIKKTMKVVVIIRPIKFKAVNLTVKKGKNFKIKVINKKTKKVQSGAKVKIKVYTGKKFKTYTRTSNKKGIINLKIKEAVGKHKIIVSAKDPKLYPSKQLKRTIKVTA